MSKPDFEKMAGITFNGLRVCERGGENEVISDSLRAAYSAGLGRAAEIAEAYEGSASAERADDPCSAVACDIADTIRAEKEKM